MIDVKFELNLYIDGTDDWNPIICIKDTQIPSMNYIVGQYLVFRCNNESGDDVIGGDFETFKIISVHQLQRKDDSWVLLIEFQDITASAKDIEYHYVEELGKAGWKILNYPPEPM